MTVDFPVTLPSSPCQAGDSALRCRSLGVAVGLEKPWSEIGQVVSNRTFVLKNKTTKVFLDRLVLSCLHNFQRSVPRTPSNISLLEPPIEDITVIVSALWIGIFCWISAGELMTSSMIRNKKGERSNASECLQAPP